MRPRSLASDFKSIVSLVFCSLLWLVVPDRHLFAFIPPPPNKLLSGQNSTRQPRVQTNSTVGIYQFPALKKSSAVGFSVVQTRFAAGI